MFQECAIKFEKTKKGYNITEIIEERDCYNNIEEFKQSLKDDDTIKGVFEYGKYWYDANYNVYQIFFNDCEECDPVFIGLRKIDEDYQTEQKGKKGKKTMKNEVKEIKTEAQFLEVLELPQQEISDTQILEMITIMNRYGYEPGYWADFNECKTVKKLRINVLDCVARTYKWYDDFEKELMFDNRIKKSVAKILKGNK